MRPKRVMCWLFHRHDRFNRHLLTLTPPPARWTHTPHTAYSCNARYGTCGEIWIMATEPRRWVWHHPRALRGAPAPMLTLTFWRERFASLRG